VRLPSTSGYFGPGRSSVLRGLLALFVAPVLVAFPFAAVLYTLDVMHGGGGLPTGARSLIRLALRLVPPTLLFGAPVWLILRLIRRESGWVYLLAGFIEGLLILIWLGSAFSRDFPRDLMPYALPASVLGASIAAAFWFLARDPGRP
jgi:hypothetical protein